MIITIVGCLIIGACIGYAISCLMIENSEASRKEEQRGIK